MIQACLILLLLWLAPPVSAASAAGLVEPGIRLHPDSLDLLAGELARPTFPERAPVSKLELDWPGLALRLESGSVQRARITGAGLELWLLRFEGRARAVLSPADSLEGRLLRAGDGRDLETRRLRSFLLVTQDLPPALASLAWSPRPRGLFPALRGRLGNDDTASLARVPWPGLLADFLLAAETGQRLEWLQFRRPRLLVRLAGPAGEAGPGTLVHKPLHLGSSLFSPLAELGPVADPGSRTPWSPAGSDALLCDSLVMRVEVLPDLETRWTLRFHGRVQLPTRLLSLRLDPGVDQVALSPLPGGPDLALWRPRTRGLDAPGSPVIHLLAPRALEPDSLLVFELVGRSTLELATRISARELVWPLAAWHAEPARRDRRPRRVRLDLVQNGPLPLQLADGRVVPPAGPEGPRRHLLELDHPRLPVLHGLPRRSLRAGDSLLVYLPDGSDQALAMPRVTGTSFWHYGKENLLDTHRTWRPRTPGQEDTVPESTPEVPAPGEPVSSLGQPRLEDLEALDLALAGLLFPLPAPAVILGEWLGAAPRDQANREAVYAPAAGELPGRLPVSLLMASGDEALLAQARALAGRWWGGQVALGEQEPDWLLEGLRITSALLACEQVRGVAAANGLKDLAHARLASFTRHGIHGELALPLLGPRAGAGWRDPETAEALAWRFALLLENLRHATRDPNTLADTRYRRLLRDLCYSVRGGALDRAGLEEKLDQHLGPWAAERFAAWQALPAAAPLAARVGADGERLLVQVSGHAPDRVTTLPLLVRDRQGTESLYFLELEDRDPHFVIDTGAAGLSAFRLDPWHSLDLEVIE